MTVSALCVLSHGKEKDGRKRAAEAYRGRLCKNHANRLVEMLREIVVDYALLDTRVTPEAVGLDGQLSAQEFESKPPMRLEVASLRDAERSFPSRARGDELWYELPDLPSVLGVIHARAEDTRVIHDPTHDVNPDLRDVDLSTEIRYLLNSTDTVCGAEWVDEAFDEFKQVWIALQSAHGRPRPKTIGDCLDANCDGKVFPRRNTKPWCSTCHRVYDTDAEIIKARIAAENRKAAARRESA